MTDPTRTYTKLSSDTVFPFDQIEQFKAWHDAAMTALRIKDEKIRDLENRLQETAEDTQDSWAQLPYALKDLEEARKQIASLTETLAAVQQQCADLMRYVTNQGPPAYPWDFPMRLVNGSQLRIRPINEPEDQ